MRFLPMAASAALCALAPLQAQRNQTPTEPYAVQGVRLALDEDAPKHTLLLRDGRIEAVLPADREFGPEYRVIDGQGLVAVPAFVDAYSHAGFEMPEPNITQDEPVDTGKDVRVEMRAANRKGLQPSWSAADVWSLKAKDSEARLQQGFAAIVSAPHGEILAGQSALALMNGAVTRQALLRGDLFAHAAFQARGDGYPSTLMGYHAQLRQFLMDAAWHQTMNARRAQGLPAARMPYDPDLEAAALLLSGQRTLVCEAESARDIYRWIALADEFGLRIAIAGGREAWKARHELAARSIPVILTLDWPDEVEDPHAKGKKKGEKASAEEKGPRDEKEASEQEPESEDSSLTSTGPSGPKNLAAESEPAKEPKAKQKDLWEYEEPLALREERRRRWEELRDNALALHAADVPLYFGSGSESNQRLMDRLRVLAEQGFDRDHLVQRLSQDSAEFLRAQNDLGALAEGRAATFCLWTNDPFHEDAQVRYAWIEGRPKEFDIQDPKNGKARPADASGEWIFDVGAEQDVVMKLEMEDNGAVLGSRTGPGASSPVLIEGVVRGNKITLETEIMRDDHRVPVIVEGQLDGDEFTGVARSKDPAQALEIPFHGMRTPDDTAHWHFDFTSDTPFEPASQHHCCDVEEPR